MKPEEFKDFKYTVTTNGIVSMWSVGQVLGYPVTPSDLPEKLLSPSNLPYIHGVMQDIVRYKSLISEAMPDAMAVKVGDLQIDYTAYIGQLKAAGSSAVALLSQYTQLPLLVDIFTGRLYDTRSTPYSIKSLY